MLAVRQVLQLMHPQVAQFDIRGQRGANDLRSHARQQHLAAVTNAQEPRDPIQCRSEVVAVTLVSGMKRHADADALDRAKVFGSETPLRLERGFDRVRRLGKGRTECIADGLEHVASMSLDRRAHEGVMASDRFLHGGPVTLPPYRASFDVAKDESYRAGRQTGLVGPSGRGTPRHKLDFATSSLIRLKSQDRRAGNTGRDARARVVKTRPRSRTPKASARPLSSRPANRFHSMLTFARSPALTRTCFDTCQYDLNLNY